MPFMQGEIKKTQPLCQSMQYSSKYFNAVWRSFYPWQ